MKVTVRSGERRNATSASACNALFRWGCMMGAAVILIIGELIAPAHAATCSITIQASPRLLSSPIAHAAIADTEALLHQAMPSADIGINKTGATIVIILPDTRVTASRPHLTPPCPRPGNA